MKIYAIEMQLIEITCACESHPDGMCDRPKTIRRRKLAERYDPTFNYAVSDALQAMRKFAVIAVNQ